MIYKESAEGIVPPGTISPGRKARIGFIDPKIVTLKKE